jgi:hypothetical protein
MLTFSVVKGSLVALADKWMGTAPDIIVGEPPPNPSLSVQWFKQVLCDYDSYVEHAKWIKQEFSPADTSNWTDTDFDKLCQFVYEGMTTWAKNLDYTASILFDPSLMRTVRSFVFDFIPNWWLDEMEVYGRKLMEELGNKD